MCLWPQCDRLHRLHIFVCFFFYYILFLGRKTSNSGNWQLSRAINLCQYSRTQPNDNIHFRQFLPANSLCLDLHKLRPVKHTEPLQNQRISLLRLTTEVGSQCNCFILPWQLLNIDTLLPRQIHSCPHPVCR